MRAKRLGCVFSAKKLSPLEMSAGYGRCQGSCLQLPRFFANATQVFLYRAPGRCKQRPSSGLRKTLNTHKRLPSKFSRASVAGCETHSGPAALALIIAIETFRAASRAAL